MPQHRKNRHLLHPRHERSRKALRHHRYHPVREAARRRHPRRTSRQVLRAGSRRNFYQNCWPAPRAIGGMNIMNLHAIGVVYRKELTEWLRDRRTLISTVVVPLLAFPILMVGMTSLMAVMMGKAEKEVPKVMIINGENSHELVAA